MPFKKLSSPPSRRTLADCEYPDELKPKETCQWEYDENDCKYDTECGKGFYFEDGSRIENSARFCHYCGGRIIEEGGADE